jgi:hypothetical protein
MAAAYGTKGILHSNYTPLLGGSVSEDKENWFWTASEIAEGLDWTESRGTQ